MLFIRIYRVRAEFCTCATYSTLGICDGTLLWLLVKQPGFTVPFPYSWKYVGVGPYKYGHVSRLHVLELKSQANPSKRGLKKRPKGLLKTTPLVTVVVMGGLFLWPKT